jgi:hypothetical protein
MSSTSPTPDAIMHFPYTEGATRITEPGGKVDRSVGRAAQSPWTKNNIASRDGAWLYATVGSNSNVGENSLYQGFPVLFVLSLFQRQRLRDKRLPARISVAGHESGTDRYVTAI